MSQKSSNDRHFSDAMILCIANTNTCHKFIALTGSVWKRVR